jgi:hypothetical protein
MCAWARAVGLLRVVAVAGLIVATMTLTAEPALTSSGADAPKFPVVIHFSGSTVTYDVPSNVCTIMVDVQGARGGGVPGIGQFDNQGGGASATFTVTPGETFLVDVGGHGSETSPGAAAGTATGGWNGGGDGTAGLGAGGGGASDFRQGSTVLLIAGGGGGAAITTGGGVAKGGGGGGASGTDGEEPGGGGAAGKGGTQTAVGAGGVGATPGNSGAGATGGSGASGGGGGYFGGGGGASGGGGGGGSGFAVAGGQTNVGQPGGVSDPDGFVVVTAENGTCPPAPTIAPTAAPVVVAPRFSG